MSSEEKICRKCGQGFTCRADAIHLCQCAAVPLTAEDRDYLSRSFEDCLCFDCLSVISKQLSITQL